MDKEQMFLAIQAYVQGEVQIALGKNSKYVPQELVDNLRKESDNILRYIVLELERLET